MQDHIGSERTEVLWSALNAGREVWVVRYEASFGGNDPVALAIDGSNYVYVTGFANRLCRRGFCSWRCVTIKYDPDGNQLWLADGATGGVVSPAGLAIDRTGSVIFAGSKDGPHCFDYAIVRYDTEGNFAWSASYDDPYGVEDSVGALVVDDAGNIIVSGTTSGDKAIGMWNFEPVLDCITVKYRADGRQLWAARATNAACVALKANRHGCVFVLSQSGIDTLTTKYDANGNFQWQARYSNSNSWPRALEIDDSGGVYVTVNTDAGIATVKYVELETPGRPRITVAPVGQTVLPGATVVFDVSVNGPQPLSYRWLFNGAAIPGETNATLTFTNVQPERAGDYAVQVQNVMGSTRSPEARLAIPCQFIFVAIHEGEIQLTLRGRAFCIYEIQYSEDLISWQWLGNLGPLNESRTMEFRAPRWSPQGLFYRAVEHCGSCPRGGI